MMKLEPRTVHGMYKERVEMIMLIPSRIAHGKLVLTNQVVESNAKLWLLFKA